MVNKVTCPVCKGNKFVQVERKPGTKDWRPCQGCNGAGYQVRVVHSGNCPRY